ncbi:MAG: T9SS type A sorting domain-containing protein [Candidatus Eisenbacteria bacterium]|nr:T9SS type A sorting domain-containing protein [Candidatus Eisenbacteria bacterium]
MADGRYNSGYHAGFHGGRYGRRPREGRRDGFLLRSADRIQYLGTVLVKDIAPGPGDGLASGSPLVAIGNTVYFAAIDGAFGRELWKSDGTAVGTVMVKDIFTGSGNFGNSNPAGLANVNGKLFFRAASSGSSGTQPWTSDGTMMGTVQVGVMNPGGGSSQANNFTKVGSNIFLTGTDGVNGIELWVIADDVSGVEDGVEGDARPITLLQNYPNPAGSRTQIAYSLAADQDVRIGIYDVSGRLVQTLVNQWQPAGTHRIDMSFSGLPDGAYFYRLETASGVKQKKMLLIR